MSQSKGIYDAEECLGKAQQIVRLFAPSCEIVEITGGLRRREKLVESIDILCSPYLQDIPRLKRANGTMTIGGKERCSDFIDTLLDLPHKTMTGSLMEGPKIRVSFTQGCPLYLHVTPLRNYYRAKALTTGASYYRSRIDAACEDQGYVEPYKWHCLVNRLDCDQFTKQGRTYWRVIRDDPRTAPAWTSEKEFLKWAGVKYREPQNRKDE